MNLGCRARGHVCSRVLPKPQGLKASWHLLTSVHMQRPELNEIRTNLRSSKLNSNSEPRPVSSVQCPLGAPTSGTGGGPVRSRQILRVRVGGC